MSRNSTTRSTTPTATGPGTLHGYRLRQRFTVESSDVEKVETVSREISSLIAQGVSIEAYAPDYYYTNSTT